jgi:SAM-dependent methyltransferase
VTNIATASTFDANYYRNIYRHYERQNPVYKMAFYRNLIFKFRGSSAARILDVGCAFGGFLASMPDDWSRFGIDVSSFAIQQAQTTRPELQLAAATLETNPFHGPFDVVTSFDVIEHIQNLDYVAESVRSLLKPGGLFLFVVPTYDGPLGPVVHLLDRDPTHIHKTNRNFWLDWAGRNFDLLDWQGAYRMLLPKGPYIHFPTHAMRAFAPAIVVAAKNRDKKG